MLLGAWSVASKGTLVLIRTLLVWTKPALEMPFKKLQLTPSSESLKIAKSFGGAG